MSINSFDNVLTSLEDVKDNANLLRLLIDIRKKIDVECSKNKDNIVKIRLKGSFKPIVASLQTSKKSIINVSLSILGNCCLDARCARDVINVHGVLPNLNQLLKRFPKEDSINGRVFRILGNLCQHRDQWANVIIDKKPQIVIHIVKYLKDSIDEEGGKVSEATVTMGVRSLRELLNGDSLVALVKTYEVLKTAGMLLIKYGTIWQETKKCETIVVNIIKLLLEYSRYKYYVSIQQLRDTDKGDSIVYLSKILLVAPRQVVKIVMNFLKMSQLKSDLPVPEVIDSFVEVLRDDSFVQEFNSTCEECTRCLCHLLEHPANRENERCGDSIPILINVLSSLSFETNNKIECCVLILATLNKCKYNMSLISEQLRCNIVTVLNQKLKLIVGNVEPLNIRHKSVKDDKKREANFPVKFGESKKIRLTIDEQEDDSVTMSSDDDMDQFYSGNIRYDYSPASSNDSGLAMSWTSGLSPQSSPRSQICGISDSDSDDYSPVCSEVDPNEFPMQAMEGVESPIPDPDRSSDMVLEDMDEFPSFDIDSGNVKQIKVKLLMEILELLKTYITVKPPVAQLGTPELLLRLVKSFGYFNWPHLTTIHAIVDVFYKILETHDFLLPLMQSEFIPAVYDLAKIQHGAWCTKCCQFQWISVSILKRLSIVAESGGGKGDIAHKLLRGDNTTKNQLVLVIPYIVRNRNILLKLMLDCGGLEILMELLKDQSHFQNRSIKALCVLAMRRLHITCTKNVTSSCKTNVTEWESDDSSTLVTFKLDDDTFLSADRDLLSKNSEFFARLLYGHFKESTQDVIMLPNVTNKSLRCLLHLIKCDMDKGDPVDIDLDLSTHLDVIGLCDRFLMEDYRVYLTNCVEKFRLSSDNIPTIYNWSLESGMNLLREECMAFALVANIIDSERFEMFKNLFDLGYSEELVDDIRKLLLNYMT